MRVFGARTPSRRFGYKIQSELRDLGLALPCVRNQPVSARERLEGGHFHTLARPGIRKSRFPGREEEQGPDNPPSHNPQVRSPAHFRTGDGVVPGKCGLYGVIVRPGLLNRRFERVGELCRQERADHFPDNTRN